MDRRSERIGGAGAVAVGALTLAAAAAEVAAILAARRADDHAAQGAAVAQGAIALLTGLGELAAVRAMSFALWPPGKVVWAAWAFGWLGAASLVLAGLLDLYGALAGATRFGPLLSQLALAASALTAIWAIASCAAAWKSKRLPSWVRVAGVVFGVLAIVNLVLPMLRALTLFAALAWWFGLGAALLRLTSTPEPQRPKTTTRQETTP